MSDSFGLLKILSIVFKVLAFLMLVLMLIGVVGLVMARDSSIPLLPTVMNMLLSGVVGFLMLYAFGDVIRLLLAIESQTRKE